MNITEKQEDSPLYGVTIGAQISAATGNFKKTSVVNKPITVMIAQTKTHKYMSGESSYVFSERMNKSTLGVSGGYGVSGVSLLQSSLSSYFGASSVESNKAVNLSYNAISVAGIEYVDFERLNANTFMGGLNPACKQYLEDVQKSYNAVMDYAKSKNKSLLHLLQSSNSKINKEVNDLVSKWVDCSEEFIQKFGNGLVTGIIWGAYGGVKMALSAKSKERSWKYGGQADFSYSNIMASVAVKAAYDGSQSNANSDVKIDCEMYCCGSALSEQINEWFKEVSEKTFQDLADVKILDRAPNMEITHSAPAIPEFIVPAPAIQNPADENRTENAGDVEAITQAAAHQKSKDSDDSFSDFVQNAKKEADKKIVDEYVELLKANKIDALRKFGEGEKPTDNPTIKDFAILQKQARKDQLSMVVVTNENHVSEAVNSSEYVPLGVWISSWEDLFPWLAQGYYNSIDGIAGEDVVRKRFMLQDFKTLSAMYYMANAAGISQFKIKSDKKNSTPISTTSLGDEFASAASKMLKNIQNIDNKTVENIFDELGSVCKSIYKMWNKHAILRNCELALGFLYNAKTIGNPINPGQNQDRQSYQLSDCNFEGKNFSAFSTAMKVLPLITPDEKIWIFGPGRGALSAVFDDRVVFSASPFANYISFNINTQEGTISSVFEKKLINLYPIPFEAADGVKWKGMSFSTNITSGGKLVGELQELSNKLGKQSTWFFPSNKWKDWHIEKYYTQNGIKKQYIGLIDEIPGFS